MRVELGMAVADRRRAAQALHDIPVVEQDLENEVIGAESAPVVIAIDARYARMKRLLDIALTLLALIPASLLMLLVAFAVWYDTPGPIIFRQKRIGANGRTFEMYKFRSMYHGSSASAHQTATTQFIQGGVINTASSDMPYKLGNDRRITLVGRFIRKTSLDELPQLFNVLKGDMSLVGPRPPLDYEVALYTPHDRLRLAGAPGLTGPWQIYGRGSVTFQEMVEQDIAYLATQSLRYDLKLMLLTVPVLVTGKGGA